MFVAPEKRDVNHSRALTDEKYGREPVKFFSLIPVTALKEAEGFPVEEANQFENLEVILDEENIPGYYKAVIFRIHLSNQLETEEGIKEEIQRLTPCTEGITVRYNHSKVAYADMADALIPEIKRSVENVLKFFYFELFSAQERADTITCFKVLNKIAAGRINDEIESRRDENGKSPFIISKTIRKMCKEAEL